MSSALLSVLYFIVIGLNHNSSGAPAGCSPGEDVFNILYNSTMRDAGEYGVEGAVGFVGDKQDLLAIVNQVRRNFTLADLEACLELFKEPVALPPGSPSPSGASNLGYNRPSYLSGIQNIPVPQPPSENFVYGHGYTTYLRPFFISQTVKEYQPSPYWRAGSLQDLFLLYYNDFRKQWDTIFDGRLRPNYWNNYPTKATG